jgi:PEP-CTERM motif-containing protein
MSATDPSGTIADFQWNSAAGGQCIIVSIGGSGCAGYMITNTAWAAFAFVPGSFLGPGTYTDTLGAGATLTITDITAVPEPSSLLLLGTGLLGLGLLVKRHIRAVRHH